MTRQQRRTLKLQLSLSNMLWESKAPMHIDVPVKKDSLIMRKVFVGFSKGVTYIKSVHGKLSN